MEWLVATRMGQVMVEVKGRGDCDRRVLVQRRASTMRLRRDAVGVMDDGVCGVGRNEQKQARGNLTEAGCARTSSVVALSWRKADQE